MQLPRLMLALFVVAQAYDGVFTYFAVRAYGVDMEANFVLSTWMVLVGVGPTLVAAKAVAVGAGLLVYLRGLHGLLAALTGIYAAAAIGPWLYVYVTWP
jgi:hypothetical protein